MNITSIFDGIEDKEREKISKNLDTKTIIFHKNSIIFNNLKNTDTVGIIINGNAIVEKYDYDGNRFIIENLTNNSIFSNMIYMFDGEISIIAKTECEVLLFDYVNLVKKNKNKKLLNNLFEILSYKIIKLNTRIDILSKKTIREKIIKYLNTLSNNKYKKTITLSYTYTDLADYLCVDRSAMMREIKKMKEDGTIIITGKTIKLLK